MSDPVRRQPGESASGEVLEQVVRESRTDLRPAKSAVDWASVEEALLARVATERAQEAALVRFRGSWTWAAMAGLTAAAAAAAMFLGHRVDHKAVGVKAAEEPGVSAPSKDDGTSTLAAKLGAGDVLVGARGSISSAAGHAKVGVGTVVETHKARALWEAAGHATWLLEEDSRVAVEASVPLILGLERGALEAQVVPVANGEAFAVDVGDARVAVHGTHLRIARDGDEVTVDLSEGVVSIGRPPRTGSTYGTLVVAPAHVQFELGDLAGSMRVTHDVGAVRPAVSFAAFASVTEGVAVRAAHAGGQPGGAQAAPGRPAVSAPTGGAHPSSRNNGGTDVVAIDPRAEETIAAAVRGCAADAPHSTDVTVTVSSSLELTVGEDGFVGAARFNPPLAPEIQKCASTAIYKTRFGEAGARKIDIVLQR